MLRKQQITKVQPKKQPRKKAAAQGGTAQPSDKNENAVDEAHNEMKWMRMLWTEGVIGLPQLNARKFTEKHKKVADLARYTVNKIGEQQTAEAMNGSSYKIIRRATEPAWEKAWDHSNDRLKSYYAYENWIWRI